LSIKGNKTRYKAKETKKKLKNVKLHRSFKSRINFRPGEFFLLPLE
jgi:hypothetical protein